MRYENDFSKTKLINYIIAQLNGFFPDNFNKDFGLIDECFDIAMARTETSINAVKMWREGVFDYLHSSQYCIFLYFLANQIWINHKAKNICTKLFYLNKSLNGIDLFYEIQMPRIFFIGHSAGIVLAKAHYGEYLVLYQNSTIGKNNGCGPTISDGCILYPNTAIIGNCQVAKRTTLSQGANLIDENTFEDSLIFGQKTENRIFKKSRKCYIEEYFRGIS